MPAKSGALLGFLIHSSARARDREEDVQRRVDAEQVRQPLQLVPVERPDLALLPLVERGAGDAEQRGLLGDAELPGLGQAKEGAQAGGRDLRRAVSTPAWRRLEQGGHRAEGADGASGMARS